MAVDATVRGFTLIELMIALAIGAILLMLGLPSFNEFLRNSEIRSTTESLVNGLRVARTEAVRRNQLVTFTLASGGDPSWRVDQVSTCPASSIQTYSRSEGGTNVRATPKNIDGSATAAVSVTFNGVGRIIATPMTTSCTLATTPNLQRLDVASTLTGVASRPLHIVLPVDNGTQAVRVCDPALPSTDPRAC